jgi:hypothetical protein
VPQPNAPPHASLLEVFLYVYLIFINSYDSCSNYGTDWRMQVSNPVIKTRWHSLGSSQPFVQLVPKAHGGTQDVRVWSTSQGYRCTLGKEMWYLLTRGLVGLIADVKFLQKINNSSPSMIVNGPAPGLVTISTALFRPSNRVDLCILGNVVRQGRGQFSSETLRTGSMPTMLSLSRSSCYSFLIALLGISSKTHKTCNYTNAWRN